MADYLFEKSNSSHPGIVILQSGATTTFPIDPFVATTNDAIRMLDCDSEFYNMLTTAIPNTDELNNFIKLGNKYCEQHGKVLLELRNKGGKVYIPDKDYFMKEFEYTKKLEPHSVERETRTKNLYKSFSSILETCVNKNNETARNLGITIPEKAR